MNSTVVSKGMYQQVPIKQIQTTAGVTNSTAHNNANNLKMMEENGQESYCILVSIIWTDGYTIAFPHPEKQKK